MARQILPEQQGEGGFGYDPLFFVPEFGQTAAEMDRDETKNRVSHRGRAMQKLIERLPSLWDYAPEKEVSFVSDFPTPPDYAAGQLRRLACRVENTHSCRAATGDAGSKPRTGSALLAD